MPAPSKNRPTVEELRNFISSDKSLTKIAKELGFDTKDIITEKRIIEYDMGSLSETPWHTISSAILVNAENAEDPEMFRKRICSCVEELSKLPENILLVSHAGVGRILETVKEGIEAKLFYDLPPYKNASGDASARSRHGGIISSFLR